MSELTFNQISTVLKEVYQQATGKTTLAPVDTNSFIAVATTALETGYDPVLKAISQTLSKTIFSNRNYKRKLKSMNVSDIRYGNHVRKLSMVDSDGNFENDSRQELTDGESIDMYAVNKPKVLQTNFYGQDVYEKSMTIFKDQIDCAISGPDQFAEFLSMIMTNAKNQIETAHESTARLTLSNYIAGKSVGDVNNVIKLVTMYNNETGLSLTSETVKQPDNYPTFMRWALAKVMTISDFFTERTIKFHTNIAGKEVTRYTPKSLQRLYLYSPEMNNMSTNVLSTTFNDEYLKKIGDYERVNYWQSIDTPTDINIKPKYMDIDGTLKQPEENVVLSNVFGVMTDYETLGYNVTNQWQATTPFNAKGGYSNIFWHFTDRYWNDFTENGVIFLLA